MGIERVSAPDAYKLLQVGYVPIDVRAPEEYRQGHPKGALNVPYKLFGPGGGFKPNPDFMRVMQAVFAKDQRILLIGKIGKRSYDAAVELEAAGYTTLCELRPGVKGLVNNQGRYDEDGWETLGLPMEPSTDGGSYEEMKKRAGD
jgi:rhodanese-related sulfurtransferase